jgi:hypothetical protein
LETEVLSRNEIISTPFTNASVCKALSNTNEFYDQLKLKLEIFIDMQITPGVIRFGIEPLITLNPPPHRRAHMPGISFFRNEGKLGK